MLALSRSPLWVVVPRLVVELQLSQQQSAHLNTCLLRLRRLFPVSLLAIASETSRPFFN